MKTHLEIKTRLDEIASRIKAGENPEKFEQELDILTENTMEPRNTYEESHWEENYRNNTD